MTAEHRNKIVRSEEVEDVLSRPPGSIVRAGSAVIGAIVLVLIIGCFIFRYPDTITGNITLTRTNPPVWIVAKSTGKLKALYVKDGRRVKQGDIIAVIENPANTDDVIRLKAILGNIEGENYSGENLINQSFNLGDIQANYSSFITALTDYRNFMDNNLYDQEILTEKAMLNPYRDYRKSIKRQVGMGVRQYQLGQNNYEREKVLYDKGLISKSEFESAEKSLLDVNMTSEQTNSSLSNANVQVAQVNSDIAELRVQKEQNRMNVMKALKTATEELGAAIKKWEETYVLASPMNGIISYNEVWSVNQNITTGDKAFAFMSNGRSKVIGKVEIPTGGSGKVKAGQRVNVMLSNYPYMEYGYVVGTVKSISSMPSDDKYVVTVNVASPVTTSNGRRIPLNGDQPGTAEVQTDDRSLGARLIGPLIYLFEKHVK